VSSPPRGRGADHDEDLGRRAMGHRHARRLVADRSSPSFSSSARTDGSGIIAAVGTRIRRFAVGGSGLCRRLPVCVRERWSSTLGSVFRLLRGIRRRSLPRESRTCPRDSPSSTPGLHRASGNRRRARSPAGRGRGHSWRRRRGAALNESPLLPSGFRLFPL
jgi:hypothetical protein